MPISQQSSSKSLGEKPTKDRAIEIREIPKDFVEMPNNNLSTSGKYYNSKIYCRPLKGSEIMTLADIDENNADDIIDSVLKGATWFDNEDFSIDDIFVNDKLNLIFYIRVLTYKDPNFKINHYCQNEDCGANNKIFFDMGDVKINYISENLTEDDFVFVTSDKVKLEFNLITIKKQKYIKDMLPKLEKSIKGKKLFWDKELAQMSLMMDMDNKEFVNEFLKYMYFADKIIATDLVKLKSKLNKLDCDIDTNIEHTCSECGGTDLVPVIFYSEFFIPEYIA